MTLAVREDVCLRSFNTLGVEARARLFAEARSDAEVHAALRLADARRLPLQVLGGGSNLLLTRDIDALVLHMASRGIRILDEQDARVIVEAEAGEPWHPFVLRSLEMGLGGLENLSLIPGTVGAAPVQNVGAYGVELKDCCAGITALDRSSGEVREFSPQDCAFAYRDSLFKRQGGRWLILRVRFALQRRARLQLDYGPVRQMLVEQGIRTPTPTDVSRVICAIRCAKLPDPRVLGNAGSFFKNPLVDSVQVERLRGDYPDLVVYPQVDGRFKLAAGWLIDRAGWKGYREGDAGIHCQQALVLVNYGRASGSQLLALAERIAADIWARFGVQLEIEPNVI